MIIIKLVSYMKYSYIIKKKYYRKWLWVIEWVSIYIHVIVALGFENSHHVISFNYSVNFSFSLLVTMGFTPNHVKRFVFIYFLFFVVGKFVYDEISYKSLIFKKTIVHFHKVCPLKTTLMSSIKLCWICGILIY